MTRSKIIIVGGGLGGLAAALALAQKQFDVTVLERADQFREVGAGIQLGPNVFRMFKALDLVNPIEELAVFPDALVMRDAITANEITRIPINTASFKKQFGFSYEDNLQQESLDYSANRNFSIRHLRRSEFT